MEPPWLRKAYLEVGIHEISGKEASERIIAYHQETSLKATSDEVPWCASFVCAMLEWSGIPSTQSAAAKSYLHWGIHCDKPSLGCVAVLKGKSGYHVGFYTYETDDKVFLVGGNQSDSVCVLGFPKNTVLAYRLPSLDYWGIDKNEHSESDIDLS